MDHAQQCYYTSGNVSYDLLKHTLQLLLFVSYLLTFAHICSPQAGWVKICWTVISNYEQSFSKLPAHWSQGWHQRLLVIVIWSWLPFQQTSLPFLTWQLLLYFLWQCWTARPAQDSFTLHHHGKSSTLKDLWKKWSNLCWPQVAFFYEPHGSSLWWPSTMIPQ